MIVRFGVPHSFWPYSRSASGTAEGSTLKFSAASTLSFGYMLLYLTNLCRFERELEALRKELADTTGRCGRSSPNGLDTISNSPSDEDLWTQGGSPLMMKKGLSLATPDEVPADAAPVDKKAQ